VIIAACTVTEEVLPTVSPSGAPLSPPQTGGGQVIALPTQPATPGGETPAPCPAAEITGHLLRDPEYGLVIAVDLSEAVLPVVWPYGFSGETQGDEVVLLNAEGQPVARTGQRLRLDGGELPTGMWLSCGSVEILNE
jgi:hypothetical protein